jgi:hypothetical protein
LAPRAIALRCIAAPGSIADGSGDTLLNSGRSMAPGVLGKDVVEPEVAGRRHPPTLRHLVALAVTD